MQIAQQVAGFSLGEADLLRKAMGKKQREIMEEQRAKFVAGATSNGYETRKANAIFDYIEPFARYGFNKSHSVAYALIAYHTAWLKAHHPRHFMAALMSSEMDKTDSVVKFIHEASSMDIPVLPPDINESNEAFTVVGDNVRFGLAAVKGVGTSAVEAILEARRSSGRFETLDDFCEAVDLRTCNRKVIEALIKSGSFDSLGESRRYMVENLEKIAERAARAHEEKAVGQGNLFGGAAVEPVPVSTASRLEAALEWDEEEKLRYEKETLGFYITGHPLNRFASELDFFSNATTATLHQHLEEVVHLGGIVEQLKPNRIKKGRNEGKLMARMTLDDQHGTVDAVIFSDMFERAQSWLENGLPVLVTATVKDTGGTPAGRSVALAAAEQQARRIDDEYGGHPEEGESPEQEKEQIVQPELNVIDIVRLDGIRDAKVRLLCLEMEYERATPDRIRQLRDILEDHRGTIPIQVRLRDIPEELRREVNGGSDSMRLRINPHFGVQPGPELRSAVEALEAELVYSF